MTASTPVNMPSFFSDGPEASAVFSPSGENDDAEAILSHGCLPVTPSEDTVAQRQSPAQIPLPEPATTSSAKPRSMATVESLASYSESKSSPRASRLETSDFRGSTSTRPLLRDLSQYSSACVAAEYQGTSLSELARLVRLSKYQEHKCKQSRERLQLNLVSTALSVRLLRCANMAHRNLTECFRSDNRAGFANLYNIVHDVRKSCDDLRKYALFEPELDGPGSPALTEGSKSTSRANVFGESATSSIPSLSAPFLNDVSAKSRETLITFLTDLRNNPNYLANRLCSLSTAELSSLASFSRGMEPIDSVLPFHGRIPQVRNSGSSGRGSSKSAAVEGHKKDATQVQRFLSLQRQDPLFVLIHTCFASSAGPDSAEDRRRTEIWATACARLISKKGAGGEPVLVAVLNAWSAMRDWPGRSNMEWFLMKILEDGAFLLDRAEDGKRFNVSEWTTKDQIAADEFYDRALEELFGVVDDEDMTGIPEGLIELGNQILRKLDPKFVENTRSWLVYKWLFGAWLLNVVIHPEMYGLMMEYHITEYGRQKILKEVALRAQRLVFEKTMSMGASMGSKPVSTPPAIKIHIENILSRFCGTENSRPAARLLPARSITSLRETVEVHPYLVVSPADLATLVNALFPERQLFSPQLCGLRSETGSNQDFSVISQPVAIPAFQSKTDADSVLSSSASSTNSDATTFVEPAPDSRQTGTTSSTSFPFSSVDQKLSHRHEDNGYNLRLALQDMTHVLGSDCVRGSSHPCAERWAILFISADGKSLSAHMAHDFDEYDSVREDGTSSSDENDDFSDNELPRPERTQPEMDYHFVRKSIFKLVEEYDIPPQLGDDNGAVPTSNKAKLFDDRISNSESPAIETKKSSDVLPTLQSRNPYLRRVEGKIADLKKRPQFDEDPAFKKSVLISMLASASSQSQSQSDFLSALRYWKTIQQLNLLTSSSLRQNEFAALLNIFARGPRDSIRRSAAALETYETWLIWLKQSQERVEGALDTMEKRIRALRDKMWYVTDVRNSAPYEFARNIAIALKTMGASRKLDVHHRSRQSKTGGTATSYLYRVESELVELLAATDNQGGPNKLSDDQAEKTLSWLQHCDVTNLCQGEERIHRFSCEITSCVDKLIGESIAEAPVLWSSVLFSRDSRYLDSPGRAAMRDRDGTGVTWDDATSVQISGSNQRRSNLFDQSSSSIRGDRELRPSLSLSNSSIYSFDSDRYNLSRASTSFSDVAGSHSYFSSACASPVPAVYTPVTVWSPFQVPDSPISAATRAKSPAVAPSNFCSPFPLLYHNPRQPYSHRKGAAQSPSRASDNRPETSASSADTVLQQRVFDGKSRFLNDLRQSLISLLLSDLGNLVYARGSETDDWFGNLGQECIDRREKNRRPSGKWPKQTVADTTERKEPISSSRTASGCIRFPDGTRRSVAPTTKNMDGSDFPFKEAFKRLLRMFCVHPSPHAKLIVLYELENLITASLSLRSKRRDFAQLTKSAKSSAVNHTTANGKGNPSTEETTASLEKPWNRVKSPEQIAETDKDCRSRILDVAQSTSVKERTHSECDPVVGQNIDRSQKKEAVASILQSLFCDPIIRPRTLFRDLQFIAAFVPSDILDRTERGKSFWAVGLAALLLKKEVCATMVELADEIIGVYTKPSKASIPVPATSSLSPPPSTASGDRPSSNSSSMGHSAHIPPSNTYSLSDAARMLTVAAKEGNPTSQRELALFYLTNPELVERTMLPLSKPREVFKKAIMDKYDGGSGSFGPSGMPGNGGGEAEFRGCGHGNSSGEDAAHVVHNNPAFMCLAIHWMEAAEQGGDELARMFLGQNKMTE